MTSSSNPSGRIFLHQGTFYYSPNCSRQVNVPEYTREYHYLFHDRDAKFQKFLSPLWWTRPYPILAFLPLRPSFDGEVFGVLREFLPNIVCIGDRYGLDEEKLTQWKDLERALINMANLLNKHYTGLASLRPPAPSLRFTKTYSDHRTARLQIAASRDWFLMWMSVISTKMVDIYSIEHTDVKDWFSHLMDEKIPEVWLSSVKTSICCTFSALHPRVGTFLDIYDPQPRQPPVEWFVKHHIPVWYRWDRNSNPTFDDLQPPPHAFQDAMTYLSKTPSSPLPQSALPPLHPRDLSDIEYRQAQRAYLATKPWELFFSTRAERNKRIIAAETNERRTMRLNRERKPPTVSCQVYEWDWSEDGTIQLVRTSVPKKMREETLSTYSAAQSRYDPVVNEWNVCEYFGDGKDDNSDDDNDDYVQVSDQLDQDLDGTAEEREALNERHVEEVQQDSGDLRQYSVNIVGHSVGPERNLSHSVGQINIQQYLHLYYGFLPPIPIPAADPNTTNVSEWNECLKCVGLDANVNPPIQGLTSTIIAFIKGMLQFQNATNLNVPYCDLFGKDHSPFNMNVLTDIFRRLPNGYFLLSSTKALRVDVQCMWQIALTTSVNALYVVRYLIDRAELPTIQELAQHLAEEGIPFCTYLKLEKSLSSLSLSSIVTPIPSRGVNYKFTVTDYEMYISTRRRLLSTPRARAAILQGGIVGRLAKECLAIDDVLFGPSSAVTLYRLGNLVESDAGAYWDDGLTADEISVLCGVFECHTGYGKQVARLSWWPLPEYWDQSFNSYNWGLWTEWDEHWYHERLMKIQSGMGEPLTHNEWRRKLKSAPSWRKITSFIRKQSDKKCEAIPPV